MMISYLHKSLDRPITLNISDSYRQTRILMALHPSLSSVPQSTMYRLWQDASHRLAGQTRPRVLEDLRILTPILSALGGSEALREIYHAIKDLDQSWP